MGFGSAQSPPFDLPFVSRTSINDEAIIQTLKQGSGRTASDSSTCAGCPVRVCTLWGDHKQMFQYRQEYFQCKCEGGIRREVPKGKKPNMCVRVCGVKAAAQCPKCVQGKCEAGREAGPFLPKHSDVLFIRGGKASSVFNLATTLTAAGITAFSKYGGELLF